MIDPSLPVQSAKPSAPSAATASATEIASAAMAKSEPPLVHADALPVGTKLGEFEILSLLGVGGFGMVYRAYDHSLHRTVAIKEYMPSAMAGRSQGLTMATRSSTDQQTLITGLRSFVSEARLLAQFDHPSLVKVYRFWEANNTAYMSMPLYRGMTLRQARSLLRSPPTEEWLRTVLWAILGALKYLHENNIVHRDVSPDNIFLQELGPPVLLDLGAARRTITDTSHRHTAILKVNYAPIEQYAGAGDMRQGPWTDLYSVAAVIHGCLCNEPPLPATFRVLRDRMPTFTSVAKTVETHFGQLYSAEFVRAIEHAMAIQPQNRPQSVQDFCDEMNLHPPQDIQRFAWAEGISSFSALAPAEPAQSAEPAAAERAKARSKTADMSPTLDTSFEHTVLMPHASLTHGIRASDSNESLPMSDPEFATMAEASASNPTAAVALKSAKTAGSNVNRWVFAVVACLGLVGAGLWLGGGSTIGSKNTDAAMASRPAAVPESGPGSETIIASGPSLSASAAAGAASTAQATATSPVLTASVAAAASASAPVSTASAPLSAASAAQAAASAAARKAAAAAKLPASSASASQTATGSAAANGKPEITTSGTEQRGEPSPGTVPARQSANASTAAPARGGPQAACAEANFLARPMCIFNECEKPEFTKLAFCVENRRRLQESSPNQNR
jgi:serine/threonine protein kinase